MKQQRPAYYAPTGSVTRDLIALLHPPYTLWFLSYAVLGAAMAPDIDWWILAGTLTALGIGLGIGAHALDELNGRPLGTSLSDRVLRWLGWGGLLAAAAAAIPASVIISPWSLVWGVVGAALAAGYTLERPVFLHSDLGFALTWGPFPVLVGYWAQTENVSPVAVGLALASVVLSLAQRALSSPARFVRREAGGATVTFVRAAPWTVGDLLASWERPLRYLSWALPLLAAALLAQHL